MPVVALNAVDFKERADQLSLADVGQPLAYTNARVALDQALAQEQIMDGVEAPTGLQVMNFHKAKGKQFDGVVIVREARRTNSGVDSSFVWRGDAPPYPKSRRVLRVGITRARSHTLLLDPLWPACPLLPGHRL